MPLDEETVGSSSSSASSAAWLGTGEEVLETIGWGADASPKTHKELNQSSIMVYLFIECRIDDQRINQIGPSSSTFSSRSLSLVHKTVIITP